MKKTLAILLILSLISALAACGKPAAVPNTALVLGEKFLFDLDYEQSLLQFDQALTIEPKNPRAWLGKYAAQELMGNHEQAVQTLREAKKKAGGDAIKTALKAAVISAEEGLLSAAEAYKGLGFREIALLLLQLCIKVYERAERFVAALTALEQEPVTDQNNRTVATDAAAKEIKLEQYILPFTNHYISEYDYSYHICSSKPTLYFDWDTSFGKFSSFNIKADQLRNLVNGDGIHVTGYSEDGSVSSVDWNTPNLSVYGIRPGMTLAQANEKVKAAFGNYNDVQFEVLEGFSDRNYFFYFNFYENASDNSETSESTIFLDVQNDIIVSMQVYNGWWG